MKTMRMILKLPFGPLLFSVALLSSLSVGFVGFRSLVESREATVRLAEVRSRNLVNSADQNITAMLNRIDHTLLSVADSIERDLASGGLDRARMKRILAFEERYLPEAAAIRVTNSGGPVILNNSSDNPRASLDDRTFFSYLKDHPEAGLFVTKPVQGLFTPKWAIPCARRYNLPDGRFGGIVVAPVPLEHFEQALGGYDVGPGGLRTLRDIDGGFIARYPTVVKGQTLPVGDKTISGELKALIRSRVSQETYFSTTPYDQTKRTLTFRRMKAAPFIVVAGLAEEDYLAQWYRDRARTLAVVAAFIAGTWLTAWLLWRSWKGQESDAQALKQSETKYRNLLDSLDALVYVADMTTYEILMLNKYGQKVFGNIVGKKCWQTLQSGQSGPCAFCTNDRLLLPSGEPAEPIVWEFQNTVNNHWYECRDQAIKWSDGRVVRMEIATDITERKKLERQLSQAQKMESIGHLAGGIAHDFNNMLTAIIGYASLLNMKIEKDDPLRQFVDQILSSAEKSANLTQQLLAFSRKQIISPKETNLNKLINGVEGMLQRLIGEDIEFKTSLADKDIFVMVDPGQIEQVLMNLCTNARDAMPHGGLLSISTDIAELDKDDIKIRDLEKPGRYAFISFSDTGCGMDEKTQQSIFEPFFTTKEAGKGTGLGLSIVYGVIKQHNGNVAVYSEPGKGTTFKIYLPLIKSVPEAKVSEVITPKGGTETILITEDNKEVRVLTRQVLEEFGYKVIEAVDGEEAINKFQENKDVIKLVILDVIMPRKSGKEAGDEIKKIKPDARILFTSGYTVDSIHKQGIIEKGMDFISKPVTPHDLLVKVRGILDK